MKLTSKIYTLNNQELHNSFHNISNLIPIKIQLDSDTDINLSSISLSFSIYEPLSKLLLHTYTYTDFEIKSLSPTSAIFYITLNPTIIMVDYFNLLELNKFDNITSIHYSLTCVNTDNLDYISDVGLFNIKPYINK